MNFSITSVGGRAPPVRNTPTPSAGSRWHGAARGFHAPVLSTAPARRSSTPGDGPDPVPLAAPNVGAFPMNTRSSRRRTGSPPTASRAGLRARIPSGPLALEPLVSICSVFPWTPSSQEMEPPENPVRFNPGRETEGRGRDHGRRRAAGTGGRRWRYGTTRRRDRPSSRWRSCCRRPTRRRPSGSTSRSRGASSRGSRRGAGRWRRPRLARVGGRRDRRRAPGGAREVSARRLLGAHLPAAERSSSVLALDPGQHGPGRLRGASRAVPERGLSPPRPRSGWRRCVSPRLVARGRKAGSQTACRSDRCGTAATVPVH